MTDPAVDPHPLAERNKAMTRAPAAVSAERIAEIERFDLSNEIASADAWMRRWKAKKEDEAVLFAFKFFQQARLDLLGHIAWQQAAFDAATARATKAEAGREAERAAKTTAWADAGRLRVALLTVLGDAEHGQHMTWPERIKIGRDAAALTPTPPAVATVAPEGPSEASSDAYAVMRALRNYFMAENGDQRSAAWDVAALELTRLAGRGRA